MIGFQDADDLLFAERYVTWQVYGIGNELVAEYMGTSPSTSSPSKEYGYRNGQLLIAATAANSGNVQNVNWTNTPLPFQSQETVSLRQDPSEQNFPLI